jgi:hypothetical protein
VSSRRGLCIIGPCIVDTSLCMHFFYNSRTHVITLYSGHVCVVLCVNDSVLTTHMYPGYDKQSLLKDGMSHPNYSNTKTHCKLYYIDDVLYLDYQS